MRNGGFFREIWDITALICDICAQICDILSNTPFYGDSLNVLKEQLEAASVDLIWRDPPFNSKRDCHMPLGGKAQASSNENDFVLYPFCVFLGT